MDRLSPLNSTMKSAESWMKCPLLVVYVRWARPEVNAAESSPRSRACSARQRSAERCQTVMRDSPPATPRPRRRRLRLQCGAALRRGVASSFVIRISSSSCGLGSRRSVGGDGARRGEPVEQFVTFGHRAPPVVRSFSTTTCLVRALRYRERGGESLAGAEQANARGGRAATERDRRPRRVRDRPTRRGAGSRGRRR